MSAIARRTPPRPPAVASSVFVGPGTASSAITDRTKATGSVIGGGWRQAARIIRHEIRNAYADGCIQWARRTRPPYDHSRDVAFRARRRRTGPRVGVDARRPA